MPKPSFSLLFIAYTGSKKRLSPRLDEIKEVGRCPSSVPNLLRGHKNGTQGIQTLMRTKSDGMKKALILPADSIRAFLGVKEIERLNMWPICYERNDLLVRARYSYFVVQHIVQFQLMYGSDDEDKNDTS